MQTKVVLVLLSATLIPIVTVFSPWRLWIVPVCDWRSNDIWKEWLIAESARSSNDILINLVQYTRVFIIIVVLRQWNSCWGDDNCFQNYKESINKWDFLKGNYNWNKSIQFLPFHSENSAVTDSFHIKSFKSLRNPPIAPEKQLCPIIKTKFNF